MKGYFQIEISKIQRIESRKLDSTRKLYRTQFSEQIDDMIYIMGIEEIILLLDSNSTREELDRIDKDPTHIINVVCQNIKRPNRTVPFSMKKLWSRTKVMFWKTMKSKSKGNEIDCELMN